MYSITLLKGIFPLTLSILTCLVGCSQAKYQYAASNKFFDDGRRGAYTATATKRGDTLFLYDEITKSTALFLPIKMKGNRTLVSDKDVIPGVGIYRKKNNQFYRRVCKEVNVAFFGANSNKAENTLAIQQAFDAVAGEGGGIIYFPPGKYKHNGVAYLGSNLELYGAGAELNYTGKSDGVFIGTRGSAARNIYIHDIAFMGGRACIRVGTEYADPNIVRNVRLDKVNASGSLLAAIWAYHCDSVSIKNCYVENARDNGIYVEYSRNALIRGNKIRNCAGSGGITFGFSDTVVKATQALIDSNLVYNDRDAKTGNYISGIDIVFSEDVSVRDNSIYNTADATNKIRVGIMVEEWPISNVKLFRNEIRNISNYGIALGFDPTSQISGILIEGNTIDQCGLSGILARNTKNALIQNNALSNIQQHGIEILETCSSISVSKNTFLDFGVQPIWGSFAGVYSNAPSTTVLNNQFVANANGGIIKSSAINPTIRITADNIVKLYEGVKEAKSINANNISFKQLKEEIEAVAGWKYELFNKVDQAKIITLRRTGARQSDNVVNLKVAVEGAYIGTPEPFYIVTLDKKAKGSAVKNNSWVASSNIPDRFANKAINVLSDTKTEQNNFQERTEVLALPLQKN